MPSTPENEQAPWTESVAQFTEAYTHSLTASRLAMGGMLALGAVATAYLWDAERRNALLRSVKGFSDPATSWWSGSTSGSASSRGKSSTGE